MIHALYKCDHSNFEIEYYFDFKLFQFILMLFVFINILALSRSGLTNKLCCYSATLNLRRMGRSSKYKAFWRFPGIISSANWIQLVMYCNEVSIIFESLDFRYLEFHLMKNTRIFKRNDVGLPYHSICHNRHRLLKQKIPSVN